jgi:Protein of unknown function (DUF3592)/WD domain, G-beta repeat
MAMRSPATRPVVVSASDDATVRVWGLDARRLLYQPLEAHKGKVNAVAVGTLHGRPIAVSGGNDNTVRVWDLLAGRPLGAPLAGHDRKVLAVAVGELGGRPIAVSGGIDDTVRVWDLAAGEPLGEPLEGHDNIVNAVAVGDVHDRSLAASSDAEQTVRPVVAMALPDPGREAHTTLGSRRVDQGGSVGTAGRSSKASGRRGRRVAPARGWGAVTTKPRWLVVLVSIGMVLLGLVLVVVAVRDLVDLLHPPSSSRRADGVVIGLDISSSNGKTTHHPVVRFVTAREQVIEFTSNVYAGESVGDSVKVRYDPNNPRHARLDSGSARVASGFFDILFLLVGLAVALGGGVLFWWFGGEVGRVRRPAPPGGGSSARLRRRTAWRRRRVRHRGSGGTGDGAGSTPAR